MGAKVSGKFSVVTSFSAKGFEEYGARFVETFRTFWPAEVALYVVSEDWLPIPYWHLSASPAASDFLLRHQDSARAKGTAPEQMVREKRGSYNFRFDAYRFCKKVFAIDLIAKEVKTGKLFWVDGDVETFAEVPLDLLAKILPAGHAVSCLDRGHYHSECGFVGYDLDHPACRPFIEAFAALYGSDEVFNLGEWHDSWVFDWLRRKMSVPTFAIPHNSRSHPFVNSDLGHYMDHKKGRRKVLGKTPTQEVLSSKKRALPYWQKRDIAR